MTFTTLSNMATMLFCIAVLIQSVRMMRCLRAMKSDAFGTMVAALDTSTAQARRVLADLRETLRVDCAANARVIATGTAMREELTVMAGIADAAAERIVEAVGAAGRNGGSVPVPDPTTPAVVPDAAPPAAPAVSPAVKAKRKPRSRTAAPKIVEAAA
jgi:hypothetical protein